MEQQSPDDELDQIYSWIDQIPLSRPKKNIARDFSDGVLLAEVIAYCQPKLVELHNYIQANSTSKKVANWNTLNGTTYIITKKAIHLNLIFYL